MTSINSAEADITSEPRCLLLTIKSSCWAGLLGSHKKSLHLYYSTFAIWTPEPNSVPLFRLCSLLCLTGCCRMLISGSPIKEVDVYGCVKSQFKHIRLPVNCALIVSEEKGRNVSWCDDSYRAGRHLWKAFLFFDWGITEVIFTHSSPNWTL